MSLLLNRWILTGIAVLLAITAIWAYGNARYTQGKRDILAEIEKARAASIAEKQEIDDEISGLSDEALLRRALKYVRNPSR